LVSPLTSLAKRSQTVVQAAIPKVVPDLDFVASIVSEPNFALILISFVVGVLPPRYDHFHLFP
jgi:hypothetical protein